MCCKKISMCCKNYKLFGILQTPANAAKACRERSWKHAKGTQKYSRVQKQWLCKKHAKPCKSISGSWYKFWLQALNQSELGILAPGAKSGPELKNPVLGSKSRPKLDILADMPLRSRHSDRFRPHARNPALV